MLKSAFICHEVRFISKVLSQGEGLKALFQMTVSNRSSGQQLGLWFQIWLSSHGWVFKAGFSKSKVWLVSGQISVSS